MNALRKLIVPQLAPTLHKGQAGRIGIVGGCEEYTGAPYFAAISALRLGGDLVHIMCTPSAAVPIKAHCPDIMVLPILSREKSNDFNKWAERLHCIVFGPGLGRDEETIAVTSEWMQIAKQRNIPIVVDADGLFIITEKPGLIRGYSDAILTPNLVEFERLFFAMTGRMSQKPPSDGNVLGLCNKLKCTVVVKGSTDLICTRTSEVESSEVLKCVEPSSARRCGGQGDILAGAIGLFSFWAKENQKAFDGTPYQCLAAEAACSVVKRANLLAFQKYKRSMITSDMVSMLPQAFEDVFGDIA